MLQVEDNMVMIKMELEMNVNVLIQKLNNGKEQVI